MTISLIFVLNFAISDNPHCPTCSFTITLEVQLTLDLLLSTYHFVLEYLKRIMIIRVAFELSVHCNASVSHTAIL